MNYKMFSKISAAVIAFSGLLVLAGWVFNITLFKSLRLDLPVMSVNTAFCFLSTGISLWLLQTRGSEKPSGLKYYIAQLCAFLVFLIGLLTLIEYIFGWNSGIDQLLFKGPLPNMGTFGSFRMSANSSLIFIFVGLCLLLLDVETRNKHRFGQYIILLGGFLSLLALVGYVYGIKLFYAFDISWKPMALHTAILFNILFFAIFLSRPDAGFMRTVCSNNIGGIVIRRLSPVIFLIPIVLGWLKIQSDNRNIFENKFSISLVTIANIIFVSVYIYILSRILNRYDIVRRDTSRQLRESEEIFRVLYEYSSDAIMTMEPPDWKFTSVNLSGKKMFNIDDDKIFTSLAPWELSPEYQLDGKLSSQKAIEMINKALEEGINFFEWKHKKYKGEDFLASVFFTKMSIGGKILLQAIVRDITKIRQIEQASTELQKEMELRIKVRTAELSKSNEELYKEVSLRRKIEEELETRMQDLEQFTKISVDRELKMEELENKLKDLEEKLKEK